MPTPILVVMALFLVFALVVPWLPGSVHDDSTMINIIACVVGGFLDVAAFVLHKNGWGYGLMAGLIVFAICYPAFYVPFSHRRRAHTYGRPCC